MFNRMSLSAVIAAAALGGTLGTAASAHAYTCSASALRGTVLTQSGLEPVVAGGDGACHNDVASLDKLPAPLTGIAGASTDLTGPADQPTQQRAQAISGLEGFSIGSLSSVPVALPAAQIPSGLDAVRVPLPASLGLLGLGSAITVDALPAAKALVPVRQLPDTALAAVQSLRSIVSGQCLAGLPNLDGASAVQGLTALGDQLPVDQPVDRAVTLLSEQTIPLDGIAIDKVVLPAGLSFSDPVTGAALRTAVQNAIAGLPPIVLPAAIGHVTTTPAEQSNANGVMEQRALHMTISMLGTQVADLVMGIARVATDGLSCAEAAAAPVVAQPEPPGLRTIVVARYVAARVPFGAVTTERQCPLLSGRTRSTTTSLVQEIRRRISITLFVRGPNTRPVSTTLLPLCCSVEKRIRRCSFSGIDCSWPATAT